MVLLLMAAGSGSRYGKLKQFDELGPKGEFLLEYSIFDAIENGFNHIVIVTKKENKEFLKKYLLERIPKSIKLDVITQDIHDIPSGSKLNKKREKPWGTAHAVWSARDFIKSSFVIINADDYYGKKAFKQAKKYLDSENSESNYGLITYQLKNTLSEFGSVSRGVCEINNGNLKSIIERTKILKKNDLIIDEDSGVKLKAETNVSMNFWICNTSIFDYIENYFKKFLESKNNLDKSEIYLPFVAQEIMSSGILNIRVMQSSSKWFGVTYYEDKNLAVKMLKTFCETKTYPSPLWK